MLLQHRPLEETFQKVHVLIVAWLLTEVSVINLAGSWEPDVS